MVTNSKPVENPEPAPPSISKTKTSSWERLISLIAWLLAIGMVALLVYIWQSGYTLPRAQAVAPDSTEAPTEAPTEMPGALSLPEYNVDRSDSELTRFVRLHTIIPNRPRAQIVSYKVSFGDSVFGIAEKFSIEPETVLWANYDLLNDTPDFLEPGMELNIPPVNGVYYQWQDGDTLEGVASKFEASVDDILDFSGNGLDLIEPQLDPGQMVMVPGGHREFRQWLIPTIARGSAGVNTYALGPGACSGSYDGAYGSGAFIYPADNHYLSGNDYWSGHLGIDLAAGMGANIYAADAGVIVFSGWANGGYGYTVMIDHGNGYQTLYAHMSQVSVPCGASVSAGRVIGYAGSTGNSTGAHLHFEVRLNGGFVNPWYVLPSP